MPQPATLWPSPHNVLRQQLTIFSSKCYQILIATKKWKMVIKTVCVCVIITITNTSYVLLRYLVKHCCLLNTNSYKVTRLRCAGSSIITVLQSVILKISKYLKKLLNLTFYGLSTDCDWKRLIVIVFLMFCCGCRSNGCRNDGSATYFNGEAPWPIVGHSFELCSHVLHCMFHL